MQQLQLLANYNAIRRQPVTDPKPEDILKIAPHISRLQAKFFLVSAQRASSCGITITCPPIAVQGALNICNLMRAPTGVPDLILSYGYATRRAVSYRRAIPANARFKEWGLQDEAQNYASQQWGNRLAWDEAVSKVVANIIEPPDGVVGARGLAWLNGAYPVMLADGEEPASQLLDDSIIRTEFGVVCTSWEPVAMCEMLGHHLPVALYFCARCGGGVGLTACASCHAEFVHVSARVQAPTSFPLPRTMAKTCPWQFEQAAGLSRVREAERWVREQRTLLEEPPKFVGRQQRVIQLDEEEDAS